MKNIEALKTTCNAIANTFYPDESTLRLTLFNEGLDAETEATPKDATILRLAVRLVMGYVESSRNENGISTSVRSDAILKSIKSWCDEYGLDADDILCGSYSSIEDISNIW